jgi:hypothetical protein
MTRRLLTSLCAPAAVAALLFLAVAPAPAQAPAKSKASKTWTPPRTPWGDPDLQGWLTNVAENGTPLERPAQFTGRSLDDIHGEELRKIKRDVQQRTLANFEGPIHAPDHWWQDDFKLEGGGQAWLIVDPPEGKVPPLTPQAQKRAAERAEARKARGPADSPEDRSLYDRCITRGLPGSMMPAIYGSSYQILQSPGFVAIRYEMVHETRLIPIEKSPHVGKAIRQHMGDARGHWEGDTLVVETTNFREESTYRGANPATLKLTERFTRVAPDKIRWSVTMDDPDTWIRPWTFTMPLTIDASQPVLEYGCHEGNYGLRNILTAARAEEKAAQDGGQKK